MVDAAETFRQHEILLIGGNGFLGKVVLGLLLDRFPDFKHLYVLLRPKSAASAEERFLRDVLGSPALSGVTKRLGPDQIRRKITVLPGDIAERDCGIAPVDVAGLTGRVDMILNCAGLVEFFPPLDKSFRSNVDGVEHVVALAKKRPAKLLHVSTCYVCGEAEGLIEESEPVPGFYPQRSSPEDHSFSHTQEIAYARERIRQICEPANGTRTKELEQKLIDLGRQRAARWGWVNTYTYAKSLGEQIIAAEAGLEYTIVRPPIVESALRFPFPGWVEGGRTAAPLVMMAMGGLRHWTLRGDAPLEVAPVDLVASAILMISALLLNGRSERVYQLGTAEVNPIQLGPLVRLLHAESRKRRRSLPAPVRILSAQRARARRIRVQRRIQRAQAVVTSLRKALKKTGLPGYQPLSRFSMALRALSLQASFRQQTLELYQPFILDNRYIFESENIRRACCLISAKDRELLGWEPEKINWREYWRHNQIRGVETWVQPEALKHWTFKL